VRLCRNRISNRLQFIYIYILRVIIQDMSEEYSRTISKQAIARASLALGFKNANPDVLESLSDVLAHFIEKLSRESLHNAELHGRAQPGIQDTLQSLESLRPLKSSWTDLRDFAFPDLAAMSTEQIANSIAMNIPTADNDDEDNSDRDSLADGSEVGDDTTVEPVAATSSSSRAWRQPFPYAVPYFPVRQTAKSDGAADTAAAASAALDDKPKRGPQVPDHLPDYPPQHTYPHRESKGKSSRKRAAEQLANEKIQNKVRREGSSSVSKSLGRIEDAADREI
jgi:hypothetical protein